MTAAVIAPIVEGHGERTALPVLLRRILGESCGDWETQVAQPFRLDSGLMRRPAELSRAVRMQAARVPGRGGVLIVRDGDDTDVTCPVRLATELAASTHDSRVRVEVVVAWREYEAWLLAAVESLTSHDAVRPDAVAPEDAERHRDAKVQLQTRMTESYRETRHQEAFSARIDLRTAAAGSRSFRRLVHAVQLLTG